MESFVLCREAAIKAEAEEQQRLAAEAEAVAKASEEAAAVTAEATVTEQTEVRPKHMLHLPLSPATILALTYACNVDRTIRGERAQMHALPLCPV